MARRGIKAMTEYVLKAWEIRYPRTNHQSTQRKRLQGANGAGHCPGVIYLDHNSRESRASRARHQACRRTHSASHR